MPAERITIFCFGASYALALALELVHLFWPRPVVRLASVALGAAGLLAQTLFLIVQPPQPSAPFRSLLFLAWILAVFYLYGSLHHGRRAWGIFVLPLVLGLVALAALEPAGSGAVPSWLLGNRMLQGDGSLRALHYGLLLFAAVGICVGFIASVMYLVQARRLRAKVPPGRGLKLLSLERLEEMNRRAITLAFPLLTAGVLTGVVLFLHTPVDQTPEWLDPRILGTGLLWLVFVLLLYLRYGFHLRGRRMALLTIVAFVLLLATLASSHTTVSGGGP